MRVLSDRTKKRIREQLKLYRYGDPRRRFTDAVYNELFRLLKLSNKGTFSYLHHGQQIERTWDLRERLSFIIWEKRKGELLPRLRHIHLLKNRKACSLLYREMLSWHISVYCKEDHQKIWKAIDAL